VPILLILDYLAGIAPTYGSLPGRYRAPARRRATALLSALGRHAPSAAERLTAKLEEQGLSGCLHRVGRLAGESLRRSRAAYSRTVRVRPVLACAVASLVDCTVAAVGNGAALEKERGGEEGVPARRAGSPAVGIVAVKVIRRSHTRDCGTSRCIAQARAVAIRIGGAVAAVGRAAPLSGNSSNQPQERGEWLHNIHVPSPELP